MHLPSLNRTSSSGTERSLCRCNGLQNLANHRPRHIERHSPGGEHDTDTEPVFAGELPAVDHLELDPATWVRTQQGVLPDLSPARASPPGTQGTLAGWQQQQDLPGGENP